MAISVNKRLKEKARQEKQQDKAQRREQRRAVLLFVAPLAPGEDPDLAGIVPGPQPIPDEFL